MIEIGIFDIGMVLCFFSFLLQYRRTFLNRKDLKDLDLSSWLMSCLIATIYLFAYWSINAYIAFFFELMMLFIIGTTVYWIVRSKLRRRKNDSTS